jgi:hypothetical protein
VVQAIGQATSSSRLVAQATSSRPSPEAATIVGTSTFSSTEHCGSRQWSWKTNPTWEFLNSASAAGVSANGFCPASRMVPPVGGSSAPEHVEQGALAAARRPRDGGRLPGIERESGV